MATPAPPSGEEKGGAPSDGVYECHICFEQAKDAVVSMCGHLFWYVFPRVDLRAEVNNLPPLSVAGHVFTE